MKLEVIEARHLEVGDYVLVKHPVLFHFVKVDKIEEAPGHYVEIRGRGYEGEFRIALPFGLMIPVVRETKGDTENG